MHEELLSAFENCMDFTNRSYQEGQLQIVYLSSLVGNEEMHRDIILPFANTEGIDIMSILNKPPYIFSCNLAECIQGVLDGKAVLLYHDYTYLVDIRHAKGRSIEESKVESIILGPHESFVENVSQNISLIRNRIKSSQLKTVKLVVGSTTQTDVVLMFLDDIINQELLLEVKTRINAIETKAIYGATMVTQLLEENPDSVFPQFMLTERPDTICAHIVQGRIVCLVDGSPSAFSMPSNFFDFFITPEDYNQPWIIGVVLRVLRFVGFFITFVLTPFYVAITTFHYEVIPFNMLLNLTESRKNVPFPPLLEALIMEFTIEMLKEAGARMPTKIGQTIGIVGGIVIGQAAVQAGFTSNILIISVAISAIASFVIPNYIMSNAIRLFRFLLIFLAGGWGMYGLVLGIAGMIVHLASISNFGTAYLTPTAFKSIRKWIGTIIRGPTRQLRQSPLHSKEKQ